MFDKLMSVVDICLVKICLNVLTFINLEDLATQCTNIKGESTSYQKPFTDVQGGME